MIIYRLTSFGDGASKLSNLYASTSLNTRTWGVWNACIFRDLLETTHPKESTITPSLAIRWGIPLRAPLTTKKGFQNPVVFCRRHKSCCPPQTFGRAWRPWKKRAKNLEPNRKSFRIRTSMVVVFLLGRFFHWKVSPGGERCLIVFWLGASHTESSVSVALDVRVTSWTQSHKGVAQMMFLFQKGDLRFLSPLIFQSVLVFFAPLPPPDKFWNLTKRYNKWWVFTKMAIYWVWN